MRVLCVALKWSAVRETQKILDNLVSCGRFRVDLLWWGDFFKQNLHLVLRMHCGQPGSLVAR